MKKKNIFFILIIFVMSTLLSGCMFVKDFEHFSDAASRTFGNVSVDKNKVVDFTDEFVDEMMTEVGYRIQDFILNSDQYFIPAYYKGVQCTLDKYFIDIDSAEIRNVFLFSKDNNHSLKFLVWFDAKFMGKGVAMALDEAVLEVSFNGISGTTYESVSVREIINVKEEFISRKYAEENTENYIIKKITGREFVPKRVSFLDYYSWEHSTVRKINESAKEKYSDLINTNIPDLSWSGDVGGYSTADIKNGSYILVYTDQVKNIAALEKYFKLDGKLPIIHVSTNGNYILGAEDEKFHFVSDMESASDFFNEDLLDSVIYVKNGEIVHIRQGLISKDEFAMKVQEIYDRDIDGVEFSFFD